MDSHNTTQGGTREQNPQNIQCVIERAVVDLATTEMNLLNYLEFRRGGNLFMEFEPFIGAFRFLVSVTGCLQDIDPKAETVAKVLEYVAPAEPGTWHTAEGERAEKRAREGLLLAQEYRQYLGSKGIISLSR